MLSRIFPFRACVLTLGCPEQWTVRIANLGCPGQSGLQLLNALNSPDCNSWMSWTVRIATLECPGQSGLQLLNALNSPDCVCYSVDWLPTGWKDAYSCLIISEFLCTVHCPKNNLILLITADPVIAGVDAFVHKYPAYKPDIYRCICSNHDRLVFLCGYAGYFWDSSM